MGTFNYAKEKIKFEKHWERLAREYATAGMSEEDIQAMRDYDWSVFKEERNWCIHTTSIEDILPSNTEFRSDLDVTTSTICDELISHDSYSLDVIDDKYYWLKDVCDPDIKDLLYQLSDIDLCILHLSVFVGLSQEEIGQHLNLTHQAVSKRLAKTKKLFKKNWRLVAKQHFSLPR